MLLLCLIRISFRSWSSNTVIQLLVLVIVADFSFHGYIIAYLGNISSVDCGFLTSSEVLSGHEFNFLNLCIDNLFRYKCDRRFLNDSLWRSSCSSSRERCSHRNWCNNLTGALLRDSSDVVNFVKRISSLWREFHHLSQFRFHHCSFWNLCTQFFKSITES